MSNKSGSLPCVVSPIKELTEYKELLSNISSEAKKKRPLPMTVTGLCEGARSALYAALASDLRSAYGQGFLLIVPEEKDAVRLQNVFSDCGMKALIYPMRDFVFHNIVSSHEYEHQRIAVLDAVIGGDFDIVITTPDAALQYTMPPSALQSSTVTIDDGSAEWSTERLSSLLVSAGYVRVDMVDGAGEFSVRGGIVDIWPPSATNPVRIDFFGDEIEQMSEFDMLTQRAVNRISSVYITPARETSVPDGRKGDLRDAISALRKKVGALKIGSGAGCVESAAVKNSALESLSSEISALDSGEIGFSDKYISLIYGEKYCLLDYFKDNILIGVQEYNACMERAKAFEWHERQTVETLLGEYAVSAEYAEYSRPAQYLSDRIDAGLAMTVDLFTTGRSGRKLSGIFTFRTKQTPSYAQNRELMLEDLLSYGRVGYDVVIMTESETAAQAEKAWLQDNGIPASVTAGEPVKDTPTIIWSCDIAGYELTEAKFAALSTLAQPNSLSRIPASRKKTRSAKKSAREKIMSYADLSPGDLIVHQAHGIGRYIGLHTLTVDGVTRDFMKIQYAGTDTLYLPCDQLDLVSKYIGAHGDDTAVKLSKMGGSDWIKAKSKAKGAAKDMAKHLIQLYAERMRTPGYAFGEDDDMQRQFEDSFEYEETDGQLEAVTEIKRDMQRPNPMDRLLCGDVGFGKTEVALRAAFKCADCGKQCVILVPTTILAMQHYQTLQTRMRGYPVTVDMLSRFRQPKQQAEILRRLRRGEIDILVGTHRLLSKDIQFKDLGLVIVDEEQRFGVAQKEKLKQLSRNVDVLTLTATPIPRTLNMAMSGIRDMSVLEEAPGDRLPVQTYVLEYDDAIIGEAIKKELRRGGQVFYLYNRVETIYDCAARVKRIAPDCRIVVAHGQMDKEELSDIWQQLLEGTIDVLVSTTIIETGVDVPNANTLIIEHADDMGLAQLHQIRGRVGRSSRRAYAYLTYPHGKVLTEIASKRLSAIRDYTEFGSGFKIAMRDLEIRGAGNLLGSEQHGHISSVGYDLYMKILSEAILEEKGSAPEEKKECLVSIKVSAFLPPDYISNANQRIDAYKKISGIENEEDLSDITDELLDRWGDLPKETSNLLQISLIHGLGVAAGMEKIVWEGQNVTFIPYKCDIRLWTAIASDPAHRGRLLMNVSSKPYAQYRIRNDDDVLEVTSRILKKYLKAAKERTDVK